MLVAAAAGNQGVSDVLVILMLVMALGMIMMSVAAAVH